MYSEAMDHILTWFIYLFIYLFIFAINTYLLAVNTLDAYTGK